MNRIFKAIVVITILILPAVFFISSNQAGIIYNSEQGKFSIPFGRSYNYSDIYVTRVIGGDTLKLENGERVRLIGIDIPKRAYEFTRSLVEGKRVSLEFDVERTDKYGCLLAYVFLKDGGTFVNAEIIKQGYASLVASPPNVKYADLFSKLYQQARENRRGLWK